MPIYKINYSELAEAEFIETYNYYEKQSTGLGEQLISETETIIAAISKNPYLYQRKHKHYREAVLKKFPFFLVYEIHGNAVIINSIFHTSRNPGSKLKSKKTL
jgi:plasmid stabilization system protein ParE